jgi:hypothetical protein
VRRLALRFGVTPYRVARAISRLGLRPSMVQGKATHFDRGEVEMIGGELGRNG